MAARKKGLRTNPQVQADIQRMALMEKPAVDIINAIREKYGKGYRVKEMKADIAHYKQRAVSDERRLKSVPKKFTDTGREHILIVKIHSFSQEKHPLHEFTKIPKLRIDTTISQIQETEDTEKKNDYYLLVFMIGDKEELYRKASLMTEYSSVVSFTILPTVQRATVLNAINALYDINTSPIIQSLKVASSESSVKSFRDIIGRLKG